MKGAHGPTKYLQDIGGETQREKKKGGSRFDYWDAFHSFQFEIEALIQFHVHVYVHCT